MGLCEGSTFSQSVMSVSAAQQTVLAAAPEEKEEEEEEVVVVVVVVGRLDGAPWCDEIM